MTYEIYELGRWKWGGWRTRLVGRLGIVKRRGHVAFSTLPTLSASAPLTPERWGFWPQALCSREPSLLLPRQCCPPWRRVHRTHENIVYLHSKNIQYVLTCVWNKKFLKDLMYFFFNSTLSELFMLHSHR